MGDEQRLRTTSCSRGARGASRAAPTSRVAVEEEFALLDPETLELVNRFEDVQAAAPGTPLEPHLVGELIASEVEVQDRPLRDVRARPPARWPSAARSSPRSSSRSGIALGATGTHPWSRWQDQRIIDTPHYRRNDELLRYVVWRNNTFGLHVHVGIRGADRAIARHDGAAQLPARAARALGELAVRRGRQHRPALGAHADLHAHVPALRRPRRVRRLGTSSSDYVRFLYETGSIDEHTQLWWSVRPHLAFPTVEIRICDAQPDLAEAQALAALAVRARRPDRARARRGRAAARPAAPADRGEHLARDPLRALGRADRPRRAARCVPARARLERLLEWVAPVADELGAAPYLAIPERERGRAPDRALRGGRDARGDLRRAGRAGEPVRG